MSDDLIKRLRDTPNWLRQKYGDYKNRLSVYDRTPFEAADRIEQLEAKLAEALAVAKIWQEDFIQENNRWCDASRKLAEAMEELREIITCWDAPLWKDADQQARATGSVINRARTKLAKLEGGEE